MLKRSLQEDVIAMALVSRHAMVDVTILVTVVANNIVEGVTPVVSGLVQILV